MQICGEVSGSFWNVAEVLGTHQKKSGIKSLGECRQTLLLAERDWKMMWLKLEALTFVLILA